MEVRLNKLISDSGLCSRREADKFIEMGRVTVNGKAPVIGKKVTEKDVVLVDGNRVNMGKHSGNKEFLRAAPGKANNLVFGKKPKHDDFGYEPESVKSAMPSYRKNMPLPKTTQKNKAKATEKTSESPMPKFFSVPKPTKAKTTFRENLGQEVAPITEGKEKFGKYNKYAAARKAAKGLDAGDPKLAVKKAPLTKVKEAFEDAKLLKEAQKPQFGKSLSKGAVAQRLASAPKSAALRKTSKNNPVNRAKFIASKNRNIELED